MLPLVVWQPDLLQVDENLQEMLQIGLQSTCEQVRACIERYFKICVKNQVKGVSEMVL